jgi:hypothetical protein
LNDLERKAEFFANLASINDLAKLSRAEKEQLMVDAVKAGLLSSVFMNMKARAKKDKAFMKSWGEPNNIPGPWLFVWQVHPWARSLIGDLVDDGEADVRGFDDALNRNHWRPEKWVLDKRSSRVEPQPIMNGVMFTALQEVVHMSPFPFNRCRQCSKFFVPKKNQKYCSKTCATTALAPWKKKYMKDYMADRRKSGKGVE